MESEETRTESETRTTRNDATPDTKAGQTPAPDSADRVLLHICCAPCAVYCVQTLKAEGFEVTGLFYNPNIHPATEYVRRRDTLRQFEAGLGIKVIYKDAGYDPQVWFREVTFREANRCFHCYRIRLEKTLFIAKHGRFEYFSSTLLYSTKQKHEAIAALGRDLAADGPNRFLYRDFRVGWQEGIEKSTAMGMYRQDYCGCLYSEVERRKKEIVGGKE